MDPISRRKLLQTSLAGVGVLSAVGVSLGLIGVTHTTTGAQGGPQPAPSSHQSHESDDDQGVTTRSGTPSSKPSVSPPQPSPPQATTQGS